MKSQKTIWNNIAPEWSEFKTKPAEHVREFLKGQTGNILDLGSGSGRHLTKINNGKMYLVDFSENMINFAKKKSKIINKNLQVKKNDSLITGSSMGGREGLIKAEFSVAELNKLPFKDNFFDSAIAISSIHCIPKEKDREKTIQELFRVLKPKAQALIGVWNKNSQRFKNSPKDKFVKWRNKGSRYYYLYEEKEISNLFKKAGFKIIKIEEPDRMINFIAEKT